MRGIVGKLLILVVVCWLVWRLWRSSLPPAKVASPVVPAQQMCCCAHCGVHFPESEACRVDEAYYCCAAHVQAGPAERR